MRSRPWEWCSWRRASAITGTGRSFCQYGQIDDRIAGFIGSKIVNKRGEGVLLDIALGIVEAIVGGFLFNIFGAEGVTGLNLYSMVVAVIGSVVVLVAYHAITGRRVA